MPIRGNERVRPYTGKGQDRLGTKRDGLIFTWRWGQHWPSKKRKPMQICEAFTPELHPIGGGCFGLEVVAWSKHPTGNKKEYEARVEWIGDRILSREHYPTRLEAQMAAELHLGRFCGAALEMVKKARKKAEGGK